MMSLFKRTSLRFSLPVLLALVATAWIGCRTPATKSGTEKANRKAAHVPFGWPFAEPDAMVPRGGATAGAPVTLREAPTPEWKKLQQADPSKKERDRRAILAMTGSYRVSFQFLETMGFSDDYSPPKPYFSWATEHIHVLKNKSDLISLQHTLVMYFEKKDGGERGPVVTKHWRQDWTYEDRTILRYRGDQTWEKIKRPTERVEGTWSQAVYQVDDSPRYEVMGRWDHGKRFSSWTSNSFRRPMPRREYSVRDDYDLLEGTHQITITPRGWVHEQNNRKLKSGEGNSKKDPLYVAKEYGVNRYERITDPPLEAPAKEHWNNTGLFWQMVREEWGRLLKKWDRITLKKRVDGKTLHRRLFQHAKSFRNKKNPDRETVREQVRSLLKRYVSS